MPNNNNVYSQIIASTAINRPDFNALNYGFSSARDGINATQDSITKAMDSLTGKTIYDKDDNPISSSGGLMNSLKSTLNPYIQEAQTNFTDNLEKQSKQKILDDFTKKNNEANSLKNSLINNQQDTELENKIKQQAYNEVSNNIMSNASVQITGQPSVSRFLDAYNFKINELKSQYPSLNNPTQKPLTNFTDETLLYYADNPSLIQYMPGSPDTKAALEGLVNNPEFQKWTNMKKQLLAEEQRIKAGVFTPEENYTIAQRIKEVSPFLTRDKTTQEITDDRNKKDLERLLIQKQELNNQNDLYKSLADNNTYLTTHSTFDKDLNNLLPNTPQQQVNTQQNTNTTTTTKNTIIKNQDTKPKDLPTDNLNNDDKNLVEINNTLNLPNDKIQEMNNQKNKVKYQLNTLKNMFADEINENQRAIYNNTDGSIFNSINRVKDDLIYKKYTSPILNKVATNLSPANENNNPDNVINTDKDSPLLKLATNYLNNIPVNKDNENEIKQYIDNEINNTKDPNEKIILKTALSYYNYKKSIDTIKSKDKSSTLELNNNNYIDAVTDWSHFEDRYTKTIAKQNGIEINNINDYSKIPQPLMQKIKNDLQSIKANVNSVEIPKLFGESLSTNNETQQAQLKALKPIGDEFKDDTEPKAKFIFKTGYLNNIKLTPSNITTISSAIDDLAKDENLQEDFTTIDNWLHTGDSNLENSREVRKAVLKIGDKLLDKLNNTSITMRDSKTSLNRQTANLNIKFIQGLLDMIRNRNKSGNSINKLADYCNVVAETRENIYNKDDENLNNLVVQKQVPADYNL